MWNDIFWRQEEIHSSKNSNGRSFFPPSYCIPDSHTHTHTHRDTHLPTARTVTSPGWLRRGSGLRADGLLISGHFFWLQRVQMFLWPPRPLMVCRWLQVCLAAPGGAPGDMGVVGGDGVPGVVGVSGGLEGRRTRS